jgi:hypothetical protein
MLNKEFTQEEALAIILENGLEEGQDLSAFQNILWSIIVRMYNKGMGIHCWQGSQEFVRFAGRGQHTMHPHQPPTAPEPERAPSIPSQPGPQPIQTGQALPAMPSGVPGRSVQPHQVPREAPRMPMPGQMVPTAPTAPPAPPAPTPIPTAPPGPPLQGAPQPVAPAPAAPAPVPPPEPPLQPDVPARG